jgi:hypothetical protein
MGLTIQEKQDRVWEKAITGQIAEKVRQGQKISFEELQRYTAAMRKSK